MAPASEGSTAARLDAYVAEWRAVGESTQPADRDRAEAAVTAIYAEQKRKRPRFMWVPSPAAGLLAAVIVGIGFGSRAVAGIRTDAAWRRRVAGRLAGRIGSRDRDTATDLRDVARRVGFTRAAGAGQVVRTVVGAWADSEDWADAAWFDALESLGADPRPSTSRDVRMLLPAIQEVVADTIGDRLLHASEVGVATTMRGMHDGQFDVELPTAVMLSEVFDVSPWRLKGDRRERAAALDRRLEVARSAGPWWARERLAILSERPLRMSFDEAGRPHSADGPAIAYGDGFEVWAWHGVGVPAEVIRDPDLITTRDIDDAWNAEARRVMIERFGGVERFLSEARATLIHEDETGRLWHRTQGGWNRASERVATVEVRNRTPEPDGTFRTYLLRVPPEIRIARQAVAWTFGLDGSEYAPAAET